MNDVPRSAHLSRTRIGSWSVILLYMTAAAFFLWLVSFLTIGDQVSYLGYLNAGGFFISLLGTAAGLGLIVSRRKLLGAMTFLAGLWVMSMGVGPSPHTQPRVSGVPVRVVTASLRTMNRDMASAADALIAQRPDILAIQEANDPAALAADVSARDGRAWNMASKGNLVVLSRFPITKLEDGAPVLKVRIELNAKRSISFWTLRATKNYALPAVNSRFFAELASAIRTQRPTIVAGDFNSSPWNDGYRTMHGLLRDAFHEKGIGPGFTFPSRARLMGTAFPLVRIDHVFVAREVTVRKAFVGRATSGADHHPLVADIVL
jgi:endonuclease/exonuclease/phosphatase (EEP) superfamily protein YafD